jgi:hypothetical protein
VHSRYERRIADPAVGGREAVIHLRVRRFFCINADCGRKTFVEQIPGLTVRHGRHSVLARHVLEATALALGGRAGARLTRHLALGVGRMTLIRFTSRFNGSSWIVRRAGSAPGFAPSPGRGRLTVTR